MINSATLTRITTDPIDIELKKKIHAPAGNQTRVSSVAGTYTITVLPALTILRPQIFLHSMTIFVFLQVSSRQIATWAEAMAQWQRVGFQTQRLGVRIPLASYSFFLSKEKKNCKQNELPKLGTAPRLPRPQRGVLLLDYFGGWRQMEDPDIDPGSQPCEGCMLPCTTIPQTNCVHRDSNPNLILGRDKYYPCTMDA